MTQHGLHDPSTAADGRVWCGVDNISVIESEIVKLKAGAVRQQITAGTMVLDITVCSNVEFNGGSSS